MPKDFYDKLQIISIATKDNKTVIIFVITLFVSGISNTLQYFSGEESKFMEKAMTEQITLLATQYVKPLSVCKK